MAKNAFDALSKTATTATKKAAVKIAAQVTDAVKAKVDALIKTKAQIKKLEADKASIELEVIDHVRPQQDEMAYNGNYTNTLSVSGTEKSLLYITTDRFIVPQEEENLEELRKVCGKAYDEFFEVRRVITVKEDVIKETTGEKLKAMADACEKAGLDIATLFDVADKVVAKDNLAQNQYRIAKEKLPAFRSIVRQYKAALK
jgi:hypothetical protein